MKKVLLSLMLIGSMVFLSCSDEQDLNLKGENSQQRMRAGRDLKSLYDQMLESDSYLDYQSELEEFADDLNFNGDISLINRESDLLFWISENLSTTNFPTYSAATQARGQLNDKYNLVFAENKPFFEELQLTNPGSYYNLIGVIYIPGVTSCEETCRKNLTSCTNNASTALANALEAAYLGVDLNNPTVAAQANSKAATAMTVFKIKTGLCADTYQLCLIDCI